LPCLFHSPTQIVLSVSIYLIAICHPAIHLASNYTEPPFRYHSLPRFSTVPHCSPQPAPQPAAVLRILVAHLAAAPCMLVPRQPVPRQPAAVLHTLVAHLAAALCMPVPRQPAPQQPAVELCMPVPHQLAQQPQPVAVRHILVVRLVVAQMLQPVPHQLAQQPQLLVVRHILAARL
jgi:hypothetical protein